VLAAGRMIAGALGKAANSKLAAARG
jgi:hypothetical protein